VKQTDLQKLLDNVEQLDELPPVGRDIHDQWQRLVDVPVRIYQTYFKMTGTPMGIPERDRQLLVNNGMLQYHRADDGSVYAGFTTAGWIVAQCIQRVKNNYGANQAIVIRELRAELRSKERQIEELETRVQHLTEVVR
jgi:hypothetical protein